MGQVNQNVVAFFLGNGLNAVDHGAKKIIDHLRDNYGNGFAFLFAQTAGLRIDLVIQFFGFCQYSIFCSNTNFVAVPQCF